MNMDSLARLRETKFVPSQLETVKLDGSFSGYASIFNEVDLGNDVVAPHAFTTSLARRGPGRIRMLFQHNPDEPIGVWDRIEETPHGLKVSGRITTAAAKGREVLELMRAGAVDGLSIGFRTVRARKDTASGARRILEADLWEISVVTFPMQESARIVSVKTAPSLVTRQPDRPSIRDFERWLVRDAGLSRSDAQTVIAKGYRHTLNRRDAVSDPQALAVRIRAAAHSLST